jgi:hypothetical protein
VLAVVFVCFGLLMFGAAALFDTVVVNDDMRDLELTALTALRLPIFLLAVLFTGAGAWIGLAWRERDTRNELRRIAASYVLLYVVILGAVLPQLGPTKTYAPQGLWIRNEIGATETHIGMVYPGGGGIRKRGAFGFETGGAMVDLLETATEVEAFFKRHPGSLVLVQEDSVDGIFSGNETAWRSRVQRELPVGKMSYLVVRDRKDK